MKLNSYFTSNIKISLKINTKAKPSYKIFRKKCKRKSLLLWANQAVLSYDTENKTYKRKIVVNYFFTVTKNFAFKETTKKNERQGSIGEVHEKHALKCITISLYNIQDSFIKY